MKKVYLMIISTTILVVYGNAQTPSFEKPSDVIYAEKDKPADYEVVINCTGCSPNDKYTVSISDATQFPAAQVNTKDNAADICFSAVGEQHKFHTTITIKDEKDFGKQIIFDLKKSDGTIINRAYIGVDDKKHLVQSDSLKYRFLIGTNFDFVDGVQAKNLYYHLQVFVPKALTNRWGFMGGIQENTQVTILQDSLSNSSSRGEVPFRLGSFSRIDTQYVITQVDSPITNTSTSSKALNLYFQPVFRIHEWNNDNALTSIYVYANMNLIRKVDNFSQTYNYQNARQLVIPLDSIRSFRTIPPNVSNESVSYQYYYGLGFMLYHNSPSIELNMKLMMGTAHFDKSFWVGYYGTEFGVRVKKLNGIIGAEYRGTLNQHNPTYFNVYLSKLFSLEKIWEIVAK